MSNLKKKVISAISAGILSLPLTFALPAPSADASLLGTVISGVIASNQMEQQISYLNNTEEGRQSLLNGYRSQYGVNEDAELNELLDEIMGNLTEGIGAVDPSIYEKPYLYFINNQTTFNAFCSMGHVMSVNTGAFNMLANDDELAVVLGHEMGHGQKNHVAKGLRSKLGVAILAQAAGGNITTFIAKNLVCQQVISKPHEIEADALAFEYITHTKYNPGACAAVWQRMIEKEGNHEENFLNYILTGGDEHPSAASRKDSYEKKLHEYSGNHVAVKDGEVLVNEKHFVVPSPLDNMSSAERAYLVAGNLSKAYHQGLDKLAPVTVEENTIMMGELPIMSSVAEDEPAEVLAERLNSIK